MMRRSFSAFAILSLWGILGLFQAAVCSAQAPQLRYGVQADQKLSYKIGIEAQVGDGRVTHDGVITYIVKSATPDSFVITTSGGLNKQIHVNNPGMMGPPFGMMGPPMGMMGGPRMTGPTEVTFNRLGRAIAASNLNDLPFVLGWREMLSLSRFPPPPSRHGLRSTASPSWKPSGPADLFRCSSPAADNRPRSEPPRSGRNTPWSAPSRVP